MYSSFEEANKYLKSFIPPGYIYKPTEALKLERINYLLKLLGNPHKRLKFIHVGGTSGKGSTSYFLSEILATQGYKTGLHVSPHLQEISERMQINGEPIPMLKFIKLVNEIKPLTKKVERCLGLGKPTYFEITVAMAFDYFAKENVDIAVVEVGLGGKLDATNVINPLISIITNVSLDHTDILGKTVGKIAKDKTGIIKPDTPVVTGAKQPSVRKIIADRAKTIGSKVYYLGKDFDYTIQNTDITGSEFNFFWKRKKYHTFRLTTPGIYQIENASVALATMNLLKHYDYKIIIGNLYESLNKVSIPGRFETVQKKPLIILDGAHNPAKMRAFVGSLSKSFPKQKFIFLVAFKRGKEIEYMLRILKPLAKAFVLTEFAKETDFGRHFTSPLSNLEETLKRLGFSGGIYSRKNSTQALEKAKVVAGDMPIIVTGSLYHAGQIRDLFFPKKLGS